MKVKHMTESQLLNIITNGYMGDPNKGYGHDYVNQKDEIDKRYWELRDSKINKEYESRQKQGE